MIDAREVQVALQEAGDHAGAFLWRRVCRDLDGELRVVVAARDAAVARRLVGRLSQEHPGVEWIALRVEPGADDEEEPSPSLGAQDRLLGAHAILWATPVTAAMGHWERKVLAALERAGAPEQRAVVLADVHLLARLSDDPEREAAEVRERVASLLPEGWDLADEGEIAEWTDTAASDRGGLVEGRRRDVSRLLLSDAHDTLTDQVKRAEEELAQVDELLAAEEARLEEARRKGERAAAHLLGAMRRETEQLLVDLRAFLVELEGDLPAQVEGVDEVEVVQRTLAHWLHHVVEAWMADRLALWRANVLQDLAEVGVSEEDMARAELLVPALHPTPVRGEVAWTQRLGATAAMGAGVALAFMGMWVPGLLAVTGGLAWSTLGQRSQELATRKRLVETAVEAVRQMSGDADRLLRDQIVHLEEQLDQLGDERAQELAERRAAQREALHTQQVRRRARLEDVAGIRQALEARIRTLLPDALEASA